MLVPIVRQNPRFAFFRQRLTGEVLMSVVTAMSPFLQDSTGLVRTLHKKSVLYLAFSYTRRAARGNDY